VRRTRELQRKRTRFGLGEWVESQDVVAVTDFPGLSLEMMHNHRRISVLTSSGPINGGMGICQRLTPWRLSSADHRRAPGCPRIAINLPLRNDRRLSRHVLQRLAAAGCWAVTLRSLRRCASQAFTEMP
jgi:hypothetical protein